MTSTITTTTTNSTGGATLVDTDATIRTSDLDTPNTDLTMPSSDLATPPSDLATTESGNIPTQGFNNVNLATGAHGDLVFVDSMVIAGRDRSLDSIEMVTLAGDGSVEVDNLPSDSESVTWA